METISISIFKFFDNMVTVLVIGCSSNVFSLYNSYLPDKDCIL